MEIQNVMSTHVDTIKSGATVRSAAEMMREKNVGCLVVCSDGSPHGLITDRDIVIGCLGEGHDPTNCQVADHMSSPVIFAVSTADTVEVARLMAENDITRIAILENGKLVGIVSLSDIALAMDTAKKNFDNTVHYLLMGMGGKRSAE